MTQDAKMSDGLRGPQPAAWAVEDDGDVVFVDADLSACATVLVNTAHGCLVPLYRKPPLTDEEREALERLCDAVTEYSEIDRKGNGCHADDDTAAVAVARGLLARLCR